MMNKSLSLAALLFVAFCVEATPPLVNGVSVSPYLNEWERTNDLLINKPREAANAKRTWWRKTRTIPSANAVLWGLIWGVGIRNALTERNEDPELRENFFGVVAGAVAGFVSYKCASWMQNRGVSTFLLDEERAQINRVLDDWKELKAYFPKQLHQAFEDLLKYRQANVTDYNVHLDRTIALVKEAVRVHNWEMKNQRPYYN